MEPERMRGALLVTDLVAADWPQVAAIYAEGIATGVATFETDVPAWTDWDARMLPGLRLVARAEEGGPVLGWTACGRASARWAYRGIAEHSVYVAGAARGRGIGRVLLDALIERSEDAGFWTLQSSILADNAASLALHERCGFRVVGRRERIAQIDGEWRDSLLVERRSARVT